LPSNAVKVPAHKQKISGKAHNFKKGADPNWTRADFKFICPL